MAETNDQNNQNQDLINTPNESEQLLESNVHEVNSIEARLIDDCICELAYQCNLDYFTKKSIKFEKLINDVDFLDINFFYKLATIFNIIRLYKQISARILNHSILNDTEFSAFCPTFLPKIDNFWTDMIICLWSTINFAERNKYFIPATGNDKRTEN